MRNKYLSGICKLIYLVTLILMFIVNKRNIEISKITLILLVGINVFSLAADTFLSELSKKFKIGLILALAIFYVIFVILIWFNIKLKYSYRNIAKFSSDFGRDLVRTFFVGIRIRYNLVYNINERIIQNNKSVKLPILHYFKIG